MLFFYHLPSSSSDLTHSSMMSITSRGDPLSFPITNHSSSSSSPITFSDQLDPYLTDPSSSYIGSASGSFQNDALLAATDTNSDAEYGFSRPEFRKSQLAGTVEYYDRHILLCYKNPRFWPPRIEAAEFDRLPRLLHAAVMARKSDMKKETRLTLCEGHDGTETSNGDVLIFPDMIRYRRLTHFDVETFVEEVLIKDDEWLPGTPEALKGFYVFVCSHGSRDRRCGVCGPAVISRFKDEIELLGLRGKVTVSPCSHIGGHKYAGNVIIYGPNFNGKVTGHWYGYVTPDDVLALLQQHVCRREIVHSLWRGQMGFSQEEQKKILEHLNDQTNLGQSSKELMHCHDRRTDPCGSLDDRGCCLGNGESSCSQNPISIEKGSISDDIEAAVNPTSEKKTGGALSRADISRPASRKVHSVPMLLDSWEKEDTYAVLAVVCAAVSVAFAYGCYKQLR